MAEIQNHDHVTEIQVLSLLPDREIYAKESPVSSILSTGLQAAREDPDCVGVYWMRQGEDPTRIAIVSSR